ncbi:hypothetical protein AADZ86_14325 [Colwelliaceae bacterium BS250]
MKNIFIIITALLLAACSSTDDSRASIANKHMNVLGDMEQFSPGTLHKINEAPGFAIFNAGELNLIFVSTGSGQGAVYNNITGEKTYMDVVEAGVGLGVGGQNFSVVVIFNTEIAMQSFIDRGWEFNEEAEASAKTSATDGLVVGDLTFYRLTKTGLQAHLMLKGTHFSHNDDLNPKHKIASTKHITE